MDHPMKKYMKTSPIVSVSTKIVNWVLIYPSEEDPTRTRFESEIFELEEIHHSTAKLVFTPEARDDNLHIEFLKPQILIKVKACVQVESGWSQPRKYQRVFMEPIARICPLEIKEPLGGLSEEFDSSMSQMLLARYPLNIITTFEISTYSKVHRRKNPGLMTVLNKLEIMLRRKDFCDVTFLIDDKKFPAHKAMLAAHSKVFQKIFLSPKPEEKSDKIRLLDVSPEAFEVFLQYIYTGKPDDLKNIVHDVELLADRYQITELQILCENYLFHEKRESLLKRKRIEDDEDDDEFQGPENLMIFSEVKA